MKNYIFKFFLLLLGMTVGWLAVLPYVSMLLDKPLTLTGILAKLLQVTIINALIVGLGLFFSKKIGCSLTTLSFWSVQEIKNKIIKPGLMGGIFVGLAILFFDVIIFRSTFEVYISPLYGLLASLYGAINEEIINRLFFLSLIVWILQKIMPLDYNKMTYWLGIIVSSLLFGLGHVPAAAQMGVLTAFIVFRILLLNGLAGVVFGYLFWQNGLLTSIFAHFIADLLLHVIPYLFFKS